MKNCLLSGEKQSRTHKITSTELFNQAKKISISIDKSWHKNESNYGVKVVALKLLFLLVLIFYNIVFHNKPTFSPKYHTYLSIPSTSPLLPNPGPHSFMPGSLPIIGLFNPSKL